MTAYCSRCGSRREEGQTFCPSCGAQFGQPTRHRRHGGHPVTGLLLALLGGAWLFVPFWPSSLGNLSLWQSHDVCSSVLGALAPSDCSRINLLWAIGLGLIGLGAITLLAAALRPQPSDLPAPHHDRSSEPSRPVEPTVAPLEPVVVPLDPAAEQQAVTGVDARRVFAIGVLGLIVVVGAVVLAADPGDRTANRPTEMPAPTALVGVIDPDLPAIPVGTASVTVDVPVIACATTYGTGEIQQPHPASLAMALPESIADRLALFATNYEQVLAPREFRCTAEVGANGTSALTVSSFDDSAAIIAENAAASFGYVLDLACPLFPEAATLAKQEFDQDCQAPPADEVVTRDGAIAYFEDSAGVAGTGARSGGALGAIGAVAFAGGDSPGAIKITCLLPNEDRALCELLVSDWVSSFRTVQ